jgi:hypothetical protein
MPIRLALGEPLRFVGEQHNGRRRSFMTDPLLSFRIIVQMAFHITNILGVATMIGIRARQNISPFEKYRHFK